MGGMGGMGPGQDPFGHREEVRHFDKASHEKTHRWQDERRARRRTDGPVDVDEQLSGFSHFLVVSGILLSTVVVPILLFGGQMVTPREKKNRS